MKFALIFGPIRWKKFLLNFTVKTIMKIALSGCYVQLGLCFVQNMLIFQYFLKKLFLTPTFVLKHLRKV